MTIDIIDYTESQMAALSNEQLLEVREAQVKKDKLYAKLLDDIQAADAALIDKGTFDSSLRQSKKARLQSDYDAEVERIRDGLLFYLRYSYRPGSAAVGYEVNYALSDTERLEVVKNYYLTTYSDAVERFAAFEEDPVAKQYLGEYYGPLYYYFQDATKL